MHPLDDEPDLYGEGIPPIAPGLPNDLYLLELLDDVSRPHVRRGAAYADVMYLRRTLFEFLVAPSSDTWQRAHSLLLIDEHRERLLTLWRAVLECTSFTYGAHTEGEPWPLVPSQAQVLVTLSVISGAGDHARAPSEPDEDIIF